jgi:uncharacterized membrane protein YkoI
METIHSRTIYEARTMNEPICLRGGRTVLATMLAMGALAFSTGASAYPGEELAKGARIDIQAARDIALKARHGKVTDEELEKEKGGSGLRYSFDITVGTVKYEVGVDAVTGKVLENKPEGKNPD